MRKELHDDAWDEYIYWQTQDKKTLKKINNLLKDIEWRALKGNPHIFQKYNTMTSHGHV